MVRLMASVFALAVMAVGTISIASAQFIPPGAGPVPVPGPMPPPPLTIVANDPAWGPICAGIPEVGFGRAPCPTVQRELDLRQRMGPIFAQLPQAGFDPAQGPLCLGPLGPGPCMQIARWIALQQFAQQQLPPIQQIGIVPGVGPICAGPLGPGPCDAVRAYIAQASMGGLPNGFNFQQVQWTGAGPGAIGPMCTGPFGPAPCALVGQAGLDAINRTTIPTGNALGLPLNGSPARLGSECAKRSGMDIGAFVGCTGQQIILPESQQAILDCAVSSATTEDFGKCAAAQTGITLSDSQRLLASCAMKANGDPSDFASCAGGEYASDNLGPVETAVLACASTPDVTTDSFTRCAAPQFVRGQERAVVECAVGSANARSFVDCAAPNLSTSMSNDQRILVKCAAGADGKEDAFLTCAGSAYAGRALGDNERAVLGCAANASDDEGAFAGCAAQKLLSGKLTREQQVAVKCAVESGGDPGVFGGCAAANMFSLQLNAEQQIAVQCVVGTGGAPPAAAGCMASRLTLRELGKCLDKGVGGQGCFGDSNDLVGKNGFVRKTLGQVANGADSLVRSVDRIWGGDNSFVRNPGQIFGGPNSFVRNPDQIFGGQNSVFHNPAQLVPQPVQLGSVGGKRICLPWC